MSKITISKNGRTFKKDGKPFFYLADTVWSAFTNITEKEWEYYLQYRKAQGFTALQINILPQWDRCMVDIGGYPYETDTGEFFDFKEMKQEYFDHAAKMCRMAVEKGFQLALVVLWVNYVPDTWGSHICNKNIIPEEMIEGYVKKVYEVFDSFNPIYVISGDTDFETERTIHYYKKALNILCELSPKSLKTCHIKRGYDFIPEEILSKIDFYMYQSGHNRDEQQMGYKLAGSFYRKERKPVINSEPCYEQMGYSRNLYGRFQREDVRRVAWQSILSGACAGITYGAHGIWNWYTENIRKNKMLGEGFDTAQIWQDALCFPGAWDYGFLREFFENKKVSEIIPLQEILVKEKDTDEIRIGISDNEIYFIYVPVKTRIILNKELAGYHFRVLDLEQRRVAHLDVKVADGMTYMEMHRFSKDALIWAWKRGE